MGMQRLSPRSVRRIAASTGLDGIEYGSAHGGYVFGFIHVDGVGHHRHGWWDKKTGAWGWDDADPADRVVHWSTCAERWPADVSRGTS